MKKLCGFIQRMKKTAEKKPASENPLAPQKAPEQIKAYRTCLSAVGDAEYLLSLLL